MSRGDSEGQERGSMKHTPGPWEIDQWPFPDEQSRLHETVLKTLPNGNQVVICSFEHAAVRESQNANARLIAAAPELLEACEVLVERFRPGGIHRYCWMCKTALIKSDGEHNPSCLYPTFEAAIAKARGV